MGYRQLWVRQEQVALTKTLGVAFHFSTFASGLRKRIVVYFQFKVLPLHRAMLLCKMIGNKASADEAREPH